MWTFGGNSIKYGFYFKWIHMVSHMKEGQIKYRNLSRNECGYLWE